MYIRLDKKNIVREIIPDIDPIFPGIPIEERYPANFVKSLVYVDNSTKVTQNLMYDEENSAFVEPIPPEGWIYNEENGCFEPENPEPIEPTAEEDLSSLLIDQEYRLTLLELGL